MNTKPDDKKLGSSLGMIMGMIMAMSIGSTLYPKMMEGLREIVGAVHLPAAVAPAPPAPAAPVQPQPHISPRVIADQKFKYPPLNGPRELRTAPPQQTIANRPQAAGAAPPAAAPIKVDAEPKYSAAFEKVWGTTGNAELLQEYEATCQKESGVGFNDQQRKYVHDVVAEDLKARAFKVYSTYPQPVAEDKLDEIFTAAGEQMGQESGPGHQMQLLLLMNCDQVAKLNSFFAGLNAGAPSTPAGSYSPALEYLWGDGRSEELMVETWKAALESSWGTKLNTAQEAYLRNTWVPSYKAQAAAAVDKLDLGSGKVSGQELGAALMAGSSSIDEHMQKLVSLMDEDQRRLIKSQRKAPQQPQ